MSIKMAVWSKTLVCSFSIAGITGSKPTEGTDVRLVFFVCCVGSGLRGGLITRSDESCRRSVSDTVGSRNLKWGGLDRIGSCTTEKENSLHSKIASSSKFSISSFLLIILSIAYETNMPGSRALYLQLRQSLVKSQNKSGLLFTVDRLENSPLIFNMLANKCRQLQWCVSNDKTNANENITDSSDGVLVNTSEYEQPLRSTNQDLYKKTHHNSHTKKGIE